MQWKKTSHVYPFASQSEGGSFLREKSISMFQRHNWKTTVYNNHINIMLCKGFGDFKGTMNLWNFKGKSSSYMKGA